MSSQDANDRCLSHGLGSDSRGTLESRSCGRTSISHGTSNRLEMLAVILALKNVLADLRGHHVLVHSDNTSVVSYLNHQGGLRSRPLCKLASQIPPVVPKEVSLWVAYIPGAHNIGADILPYSSGLRPGEWGSTPSGGADMEARVDLFMSREMSHCPLWFSLTHPAPPRPDAMMQTWPRLCLYTFPPIALLPRVLERVCQDRVLLLLIALRWPGRVWLPDLISLLDGPPLELPIRRVCPMQGPRYFTPTRNCGNCGLGLWGGPAHRLRSLNRDCETILHSRAPSTRKLYALKWKVSLHGVVTISWTPVTAQSVQCWSSCKMIDCRASPVHFKGLLWRP